MFNDEELHGHIATNHAQTATKNTQGQSCRTNEVRPQEILESTQSQLVDDVLKVVKKIIEENVEKTIKEEENEQFKTSSFMTTDNLAFSLKKPVSGNQKLSKDLEVTVTKESGNLLWYYIDKEDFVPICSQGYIGPDAVEVREKTPSIILSSDEQWDHDAYIVNQLFTTYNFSDPWDNMPRSKQEVLLRIGIQKDSTVYRWEQFCALEKVRKSFTQQVKSSIESERHLESKSFKDNPEIYDVIFGWYVKTQHIPISEWKRVELSLNQHPREWIPLDLEAIKSGSFRFFTQKYK